MREMLVRMAGWLGLHPEKLAADTAYGSADKLGWLIKEQNIEPHIPVFDKSERKDGAFPATAFVFEAQANECTCPSGRKLKKYWRTMANAHSGPCKDGTFRYYADGAFAKLKEAGASI